MDQLQQLLQKLESENKELRKACLSLQEMQDALETAYSEANTKVLRAEMSSLELEQVFQACTDALWVVREDAIVVRANEAMLALLNKPLDQVIGKNCHKLLNYGHCECKSCPLPKGMTPAPVRELDIRIPDAQNKQTHYILTTAPLMTLDGAFGIVGQFKNITERKKAEENLAEANATLERIARVDGLTQVANRRSFDESLQREWKRLARDQKPFSMILCDIDFFKRYNDTYGHQGGDTCLQKVAWALNGAAMRPADLVARYGGEEFAFLLPGTDLEGARIVASRALEAVAELKIEHSASTVSANVSISVGIACMNPHPDINPAELVAAADRALYASKEQGRNRITAVAA